MHKPAFTYDEVPYPSFTFPQTRPDRLATIGAFNGMQPAAPENCRVLELGCGDGTNLLSFAYILPNSRFVGIDLSATHIAAANRGSGDLGLRNVEFHCDDVMNFSRDRYGEFDYIVAHGLFSWVPEPVREKILEIYAECLSVQGVGYISYNAYPGCKLREMLWDMMKFYTSTVQQPEQKVGAGIEFLSFLNFASEKGTPYQQMIEGELAHFAQRTIENIYHDDLSSMNQPFYFHEFADLLSRHDLQFLSEADAYWPESQLRPEISAKLDELGDDIIRREQFTDFIKGRPFRASLVCRRAVSLDREPGPETLRSFYFSSQVEPESKNPDLISPKTERFAALTGEVFEISRPLTKAAIVVLGESWSRSLGFDELMAKAGELCGSATAKDIENASCELLDMCKKGFVYLHRFRPDFPLTPSERPLASGFVQWQLMKNCQDITALSGMNLRPEDDLLRLILLLCDGNRNREALVAEVSRRIEFPVAERERLLRELPDVVEGHLNLLAKLGLLRN
jgi:methyltransferase-like protein/spermidine synthase